MKKLLFFLSFALLILGSTLYAQETKKETRFLSLHGRIGMTKLVTESSMRSEITRSSELLLDKRALEEGTLSLMYGTQYNRFGVSYSMQEINYAASPIPTGGENQWMLNTHRILLKTSQYRPITKNLFWVLDEGFGYANQRLVGDLGKGEMNHGVAIDLGTHLAFKLGGSTLEVGLSYQINGFWGVTQSNGKKGRRTFHSFMPMISYSIPLWTHRAK